MIKWKVKINSVLKQFDDYEEAVNFFRQSILNYIETNEDIFCYDCVPFQPGVFYYYKFVEGNITDEEIVIAVRTKWLLDSFSHTWEYYDGSDYVGKQLIKEIHYTGEISEFNEKLHLDIVKKEDEVILDLVHFDGEEETYIKTNSFIFDNQMKEYYFSSHQIINTTCHKGKLGEEVDLHISLKYDFI